MFVTEYAQALSSLLGQSADRSGLLDAPYAGQTVTRLRAVMTPKAMTRDVVLVPAPTWGAVDNHFTLSSARAPAPLAPLAAMSGAMLALLLGARLVGRPGWRRAGGVASIVLACTTFAML